MRKGVIFAGGDFSAEMDLKDIISDDVLVVCADSGYDSALKAGVSVDVIIGDMDSAKSDLPDNVKQIRLKCEKDDTDTEACIDFLKSEGCREIVLLGALGGRTDHMLANIMLIVYAEKKGVKLTIKSDDTEIFSVTDKAVVKGEKGDILSLIPVLSDVEGVTLKGLKYPLTDAVLETGKTVGISNEFTQCEAEITVKSGLLIAIKVKR